MWTVASVLLKRPETAAYPSDRGNPDCVGLLQGRDFQAGPGTQPQLAILLASKPPIAAGRAECTAQAISDAVICAVRPSSPQYHKEWELP